MMRIFVATWLLVAGCILQGARSYGTLRVPRLLHRNYMAGAKALVAATRDVKSGFKAHWLTSCQTHNPDWQEIIWDEDAVMQLVQEDFPWFLETYLSYPKLVQRSDVTRYMVLYKHGGVYLDADVECYSSFEQSLLGKDLVLNCEYAGKNGQLHNAAMASAPGHPFWLEVLREAMQRAPKPSGQPAAAGARRPLAGPGRQQQLLGKLQQLWESAFHNKVNAVLRTTGPMMLTSVYKRYLGGPAMCGNSVVVDGRVNHAYELGAWFTPCFFSDEACQRKWMTQHFLLTRVGSQQAGKAVPSQLQAASAVVGIHHYSGSWTDWDHSKKQQRQQEMKQEAAQHVLQFFRDSPVFLEYNCSARLPTATAAISSSSSSRPHPGPMPLCMEYVLDALSMGSCSMVSVVAGAATDMATEQLLQQLGCHVTTVTPDKEPPQQLRALQSVSTNKLQHGGLVQHLQGLLQAVPEYGAEPPAVSLQSLLHIDPRMTGEQQQQQQEKLDVQASAAAAASRNVPLKYILRLSCNGCELPVMTHLFNAPLDQSSILQRVELLLVDLHMPDKAAAAGGAEVAGLDDMYNLLYQQHGFAGFLRQELPGGMLRLGFARHPGRMKVRGAALGGGRDQQMLESLGA